MQIGMPSSTAPCRGGDLSNEAVAGVGGVGWARDPQKTQKGLRREPKPLVFPCCGGGFEPPSFGRPRCLSGRYLDIPLMCTEDGDTRAGSLISLLARFYNQRGTAEQWIKEGGSHPLDLAILSSVPGQRGPPPTRGHRLQRRQSVASARPARRHPGLVPHESPAAPVQDWWTPHPTWPVLHPAVGRKPIDSASVCADHPAHRAARMASDVIKGAVPKRGETRSKKDLVVVFLWCF